jgi:hypothetical protein
MEDTLNQERKSTGRPEVTQGQHILGNITNDRGLDKKLDPNKLKDGKSKGGDWEDILHGNFLPLFAVLFLIVLLKIM